MSIELATLKDIDVVYDLCLAFYQASAYTFPIDMTYGKAFLATHLSNPNHLGLLYYQDQDHPVGCLLAISGAHPFFPVKIANELVWWVQPEHRSLKSFELLEAYEYWARIIQKCDLVCLTASDDPRVDKLYKRKGYILKERSYYKETQNLKGDI